MLQRRARDSQFLPTIIGGVATAGVATTGLLMARDFPDAAAMFPRVVLVPLLLLSLALILVTVFGREGSTLAGEAESALTRTRDQAIAEDVDQDGQALDATVRPSRWWLPDLRVVVIVIGGLVPVLGFRRIGYVASAVLVMIIVPILLGYRRLVWILVAALGLVLGLNWLFFDYLTLRPLPWRL